MIVLKQLLTLRECLYTCMCTIAMKGATNKGGIKRYPRPRCRCNPCHNLLMEAAFANNCEIKDVTILQVAQQAYLHPGKIPECYWKRKSQLKEGMEVQMLGTSEHTQH